MDFPEDLDHVFEEYLEDDSEGIFDYANLDVNYDIESLKDIDDPLQDPMGDEDVPSTSKAKSSKKIKRSCDLATRIENSYSSIGDVFLKKFKNQKSYEKCGAINVDGDTVNEILTMVWSCCSKFTHRAVRFTESADSRPEASWEDVIPGFDDCDRFLVFQDKINKRNISPSKVDSANLVNWLSKEVSVIVYKYSDSITSLERWHQVEAQLLRPLEKDRSGAESVASINQLKEQLKRIHGKYLSGDDVNWGCWASWISSKTFDQRDDLMNQAPPEHLINLFSSVPVHSDTILEKARLDLQVANTVNGAYSNILRELKNDYQQLGNVVRTIGERISMLETKQKEYDEMLQAMRNTVAVKENKFSVELARNVTDCLDVDHDEFS
ncbi:uncharacterized protein LOC134209899 [Armigeres subalbatus]|uniref:uncharacterized protein LOC134209899 n=1 Tax=Armigeres subalbatus TaxID=124917 RepID=UPI002ECFDA7E